MRLTKPLHSVRKFYFLDYFYILLCSIERHSVRADVFSTFKVLKQEHRLGESKYKRLTDDGENLTETQQQRYNYTFRQVVEESKEYGLVEEDGNGDLELSAKGRELLRIHETDGFSAFIGAVATLMERHYEAFRLLLNYMYKTNSKRSGVLIFPHYSPLELDIRRKTIQRRSDVEAYCAELVRRLEKDILRHLNRQEHLAEKNDEIIEKLVNDDLLPKNRQGVFRSKDYNKITKRIRDFWITHFLSELYDCPYTMATFDLWVYRAKQVGVIHVTESYPFTNGKLVYPTAVVLPRTASPDFRDMFEYGDGNRLFVHDPRSDRFRDDFVDELVKGYFSLRRLNRNYFINLSALRETVCYALKISALTFERLLNEVYRLNLQGTLRISISLEVDRLPEETNAMYLKQEPVMVDGSFRNIIAIDVTKGERRR